MKSKEDFFPQLYNFDKTAFDIAEKNHNKYMQLKEELENEIKAIIPKPNLEPLFFKENVLENFYNLVERKHRTKNPMDLSAKKLIEILEIDAKKILALITEFENYRPYSKKPMKSAFSTMTTSEGENKRLNRTYEVIRFLDDFDYQLKNYKIVQLFREINYDNNKNSFIPNPEYVKNG